jgi:rhamnogalacturonyl hydrolase YesR
MNKLNRMLGRNGPVLGDVYVLICIGLLIAGFTPYPSAITRVDTLELAKIITAKGEELVFPGIYQGILNVQAMAEIAAFEGEGSYLNHTKGLFEGFGNGKITAKGNFICYEAGGSGAAYLVFKGLAPELEHQVTIKAEKMLEEQPVSSEGLMTRPNEKKENDPIFIDVAFAVTPYLLYTGLAFDKQEYIDLAVFETLKRIEILRDPATGLIRQGRGFQGKGVFTEDNWSRGNGWAALALSALVRDLPKDHPRKTEVDAVAKELVNAILAHQNQEGLWHQEMTDTTSFVETSGSGLMLYFLGVCLDMGLIESDNLPAFKKGLVNFLAYVTEEGDVSHTSNGLLAKGSGTKEVYINHPWSFNEPHAFGAAALPYIQATKMGFKMLDVPFKPGHLVSKLGK